MKIAGLLAVIMVAAAGCATVNHSENLNVEATGATGSYTHNSYGPSYKLWFMAGGGGSGAGAAASSGTGAGGLGLQVETPQQNSDPRYFAKSVLMVDLAKKLKRIKVDDVEGIREYEYTQPYQSDYRSRTTPPSSYGYKPVQ